MGERQYTYDEIEEYLEGSLTLEEREALERDLQTNHSLQQQLKAHRLASELVLENRLLDVRATLKQVDSASRASFRAQIWKWIGGAMLISTCGLIGYQMAFVPKGTIVDGVVVPMQTQRPEPKQVLVERPISHVVVQKENALVDPVGIKASLVSEASIEPEKIVETVKTEVAAASPVALPASTLENKEAISEVKVRKEVPVPVPPLDPCAEVKITGLVASQPTCQNKGEGSVQVTQLKGGTFPYVTSLFDDLNHALPSLSALEAGTYTVWVKDAKGCMQKLDKITVSAKKCQQNQIFNPFLGEVWEIPVSAQAGTIRIYDNAGNVYYTKELTPLEKEQWSGHSLRGEQKAGYYPYEIFYQDGTSVQGSITIPK